MQRTISGGSLVQVSAVQFRFQGIVTVLNAVGIALGRSYGLAPFLFPSRARGFTAIKFFLAHAELSISSLVCSAGNCRCLPLFSRLRRNLSSASSLTRLRPFGNVTHGRS